MEKSKEIYKSAVNTLLLTTDFITRYVIKANDVPIKEHKQYYFIKPDIIYCIVKQKEYVDIAYILIKPTMEFNCDLIVCVFETVFADIKLHHPSVPIVRFKEDESSRCNLCDKYCRYVRKALLTMNYLKFDNIYFRYKLTNDTEKLTKHLAYLLKSMLYKSLLHKISLPFSNHEYTLNKLSKIDTYDGLLKFLNKSSDAKEKAAIRDKIKDIERELLK